MAKKKRDRLAEDAAKAKAAGMSYGKWKALQPPDEPEKPKKIVIENTCQFCGKKFYQNDNRQRKYCSPECKYEVDLQKHREYDALHREEKRVYNREYGRKWREKNAMSKV